MYTIDISAAVHSRAGLGRYSAQLAAALAAARPGEIGLFYNEGRDGRLPPGLAHLPRRRVPLGYKPWRMSVWLAHLAGLSFDRLVPDAALFHSTEHLLLPLHDRPAVLTVHDLIFRLFPRYHKPLNYWFLNAAMPLFCRRATAIIAVSQASKRDIVKQYGVDPAKIRVVYEAASPLFAPPPPARIEAVRRAYKLPARYLLHLGTIEPRKNLRRLLDALVPLHALSPTLSLVLVGGKGWLTDDFFAHVERLGLQDHVHLLGWVPDDDLPPLIAGAELAVQPSLYEGFGLPLLEHMASGQVVAASRAGSHPEVGGDAAAYFDPYDTADMTAVLQRLLADPDERAARREAGLDQVARFSWTRAAHETLALYDALVR